MTGDDGPEASPRSLDLQRLRHLDGARALAATGSDMMAGPPGQVTQECMQPNTTSLSGARIVARRAP
eukprot:15436080-Alexandrium_andersonii.AAC.1